jgi:hypothetical protein
LDLALVWTKRPTLVQAPALRTPRFAVSSKLDALRSDEFTVPVREGEASRIDGAFAVRVE